ncbi:MAG: peptide chain release factor N(5)-glutamine methyltransferase [Rickettsiaceae bacterium]|nr:MAG: peptide chain release factor N(5)-glutamine methyltransferase [Rickettsiaceae bacterium]
MNVEQALNQARTKLTSVNIKSANLDVKLILAHVLGEPVEFLLLNPVYNLNTNEIKKFDQLITQRFSMIPVAYILGYKEFYGRTFAINYNVLIPRPDTETLITAVLSSSYLLNPNLRILELGVGSGCVIITLLLEIIGATGIGCDIEQPALAISAINAKTYNLEHRVQLIKTNWFMNLAKEKFDIIVSNPPYISIEQKELMAIETILYEPVTALFANNQGLENYISIASEAQKFLANEGSIFLEIGFDQMERVKSIFSQVGFVLVSSFKDLSGRNRVLQFKKCD